MTSKSSGLGIWSISLLVGNFVWEHSDKIKYSIDVIQKYFQKNPTVVLSANSVLINLIKERKEIDEKIVDVFLKYVGFPDDVLALIPFSIKSNLLKIN